MIGSNDSILNDTTKQSSNHKNNKRKQSSKEKASLSQTNDLNNNTAASQQPLNLQQSSSLTVGTDSSSSSLLSKKAITINIDNIPISLSIATRVQSVSILPAVHVVSSEGGVIHQPTSSESVAVSFPPGDSFPSSSETVFSQCPEPFVVPPSHESSSLSSVQLIQPVFIYTSSLPPTSKTLTTETVLSESPIVPSYSPIHCTCTKTRCLKLYCDCLKAGRVCTDMCGCTHCLNRPNSRERGKLLKHLKKTNPKAFIKVTKVKGYEKCVTCSCQKSMCNKKYCSCYQSGNYCTSKCKCVNCNNKSSDVF